MILSRRVALGGIQLDEIHEAIVIRSINPGVPHENISASSRMGGAGQRITGEHWETLDVTVSFAIDVQKRAMSLRREIFEAVSAWASRKGWLTVNWMTNRRMYVDKVIYPSGGDMWNWTDEYTITFRAYNVPFWQDETPVSASTVVTNDGGMTIQTPGNVQTVLDATFENRSGMNIQDFEMSANWHDIKLKGVNIGGGQSLRIHHGTDGILRMEVGSRSVYSLYTGADDLYINPGPTGVSFKASRAGVLTVAAYGRYAT